MKPCSDLSEQGFNPSRRVRSPFTRCGEGKNLVWRWSGRLSLPTSARMIDLSALPTWS